MRRRNQAAGRRLRTIGIEQLEPRLALAGSVQAVVSGGSLRITGDFQNNQIRITQFTPSIFLIASRDGTTLINGQTAQQTLGGVTKDVSVNLGDGNDVLDFAGAINAHIGVDKKLSIDTGDGNDQALLAFIASRELSLNLGSGDDTLQIGNGTSGSGINVAKSARITGSHGQDSAAISGSSFRGGLALDLGGDNDRAAIQGSGFGKRSNLSGGRGSDTLVQSGNTGKTKFRQFEGSASAVSAPVAAADAASVARGGTVSVNVAANDTASFGVPNPASVVITQPPASGTATANSDGTLTYTNNGAAAVSDPFQYTIRDVLGNVSNAAVVSLTITAAPLAAVSDNASIVKGATNVTGNVLTNDTGGAAAKTVSAVNSSAANVATSVAGQFGTFRINADGTFTYTLDNANASVTGLTGAQTLADSMAYTVSDGTSTSGTTLLVTITAV